MIHCEIPRGLVLVVMTVTVTHSFKGRYCEPVKLQMSAEHTSSSSGMPLAHYGDIISCRFWENLWLVCTRNFNFVTNGWKVISFLSYNLRKTVNTL